MDNTTTFNAEFKESTNTFNAEFGESLGYSQGYSDGQQSEYDRFWDSYQSNGKLNTWDMFKFAGGGWNDTTFQPKYSIQSVHSDSMFSNSGITDLKGILENSGFVFDFSKSTHLGMLFLQAKVTRVPKIDATSASNVTQMFNTCTNLVSVDEVVLKEDGSQSLSYFTNSCSKLTDITFSGVIGKSINLSYSPLTVASMKSVINALKNYSGTSSAFTYQVRFSENCWAALEADSTSPIGTTWEEYVATLGWNT